jgi:tryptophan synthase alpha subunit
MKTNFANFSIKVPANYEASGAAADAAIVGSVPV